MQIVEKISSRSKGLLHQNGPQWLLLLSQGLHFSVLCSSLGHHHDLFSHPKIILHSFWSSQSTSSCGFSDSALSLSLFGFSSMNTSTYKWDQPFTNCQYQIPFVVSGDNYISLIFWVIIVNSDSADNVRPANGLLPGHLHHPWHWLSGNNQIHLQYFSSI